MDVDIDMDNLLDSFATQHIFDDQENWADVVCSFEETKMLLKNGSVDMERATRNVLACTKRYQSYLKYKLEFTDDMAGVGHCITNFLSQASKSDPRNLLLHLYYIDNEIVQFVKRGLPESDDDE